MKLITLENKNINSYGNGNIGLCNDKMMKWGDKMRIKVKMEWKLMLIWQPNIYWDMHAGFSIEKNVYMLVSLSEVAYTCWHMNDQGFNWSCVLMRYSEFN